MIRLEVSIEEMLIAIEGSAVTPYILGISETGIDLFRGRDLFRGTDLAARVTQQR